MKKSIFFLIVIFFTYSISNAQNISYPNSSSVKNLKIDFGAIGDGVTDDTNALSSAMNSNFKGIIFIPNGVYKITNSIKKVSYYFFLFCKIYGSDFYDLILHPSVQAASEEIIIHPVWMVDW